MSSIEEHAAWLKHPISQEVKSDIERTIEEKLLLGVLLAARASQDPRVAHAIRAYDTTRALIAEYFQEKDEPVEDSEEPTE